MLFCNDCCGSRYVGYAMMTFHAANGAWLAALSYSFPEKKLDVDDI